MKSSLLSVLKQQERATTQGKGAQKDKKNGQVTIGHIGGGTSRQSGAALRMSATPETSPKHSANNGSPTTYLSSVLLPTTGETSGSYVRVHTRHSVGVERGRTMQAPGFRTEWVGSSRGGKHETLT